MRSMKTFAAGILLAALAGAFSLIPSYAEDAAKTPDAAGKKDVMVFAAASLTDAFKAIGKKFEAENAGVTVTFNFGASNQLRTQIEQGAASADVFASANKKEMDAAVASKVVEAGSEKLFVWNRLVVIFPKENPAKIESLKDLAKPKLKFVTTDKVVPVGKYTLDMLDKMAADKEYGAEFKEKVLANIVSKEENVKAVVAKVRLGEADAGVVYVSDLTGKDAESLGSLAVPDAFNQIAAYTIAPVVKAPQPELAKKFIEMVLSPAGKEILKANHFITEPPGTPVK